MLDIKLYYIMFTAGKFFVSNVIISSTINMHSTFFPFITVDQMERMECSYVCEVLHFLLRERHGTPLVKLPVDLVDKDNEASLDLLYALFKHCEYHENCIHCHL